MIVTYFLSKRVILNEQENSILIDGITDGEIKAGMLYRIPFNRSFGMTVPIHHVVKLSDNEIRLRSDFEDKESFEFVALMDIGEESFEIHDSE